MLKKNPGSWFLGAAGREGKKHHASAVGGVGASGEKPRPRQRKRGSNTSGIHAQGPSLSKNSYSTSTKAEGGRESGLHNRTATKEERTEAIVLSWSNTTTAINTFSVCWHFFRLKQRDAKRGQKKLRGGANDSLQERRREN